MEYFNVEKSPDATKIPYLYIIKVIDGKLVVKYT